MSAARVLYLTSRVPAPAVSGGQLREYQLLRRLSKVYSVDLVVVTQFKEDRDAPTASECCEDVVFFDSPVFDEPLDAPWVEPSVVPERMSKQANPAVQRYLEQAMASTAYDLVHVEGYYMMQHVPASALPIVLVEENVEFLIDKAMAELPSAGPAAGDWRLARRLEAAAWRRAALVATVTDDDAAEVERTSGIRARLSFNGTDHLPSMPEQAAGAPGPSEPIAIFVANYSYPPSRDAVDYLLGEIWPRVIERVPSARLLLVGHSLPDELAASVRDQVGVEVAGWVEDLASVIDSATLMIAPLRIGGGIKVKVVEAIRRGCPVVTTPIGAQGFPDAVRALLHVAEELPELVEFTAHLLRCAEDAAGVRSQLRHAAQQLPSWDSSALRLAEIWTAAIRSQDRLIPCPVTATAEDSHE